MLLLHPWCAAGVELASWQLSLLWTGEHLARLDQTNMPLEIAVLAAKRKLERGAAFRQLQSICHQLHLLTGGRLKLDSFKLDATVHLQPAVAGEIRVVRPSDEGTVTDTAVIVGTDGTFRQVLPDDFQDADLLVLGLDQGSIGVPPEWHLPSTTWA